MADYSELYMLMVPLYFLYAFICISDEGYITGPITLPTHGW